MILKNAQFVSQIWERFCKDSRLVLIAICHAHKADNTPRGGLSNRGKEQADLMELAIAPAMHELTARRGLSRFYAADTKRNITTLLRIMPPSIPCDNPEQLISTPAELDIPFMGPNDEDAETCTKVAKKLGISRNEAFALVWEEHGFKRIGEPRATSLARIRTGLESIMCDSRRRSVVFYCGNSPLMDEALGIPGVMAELEALFFAYENGQFRLLGRVAPEFSDD